MPDRYADDLPKLTTWITQIIKSKLSEEQKADMIGAVIKGTTPPTNHSLFSMFKKSMYRFFPTIPSARSEEPENHDDFQPG